ncbi:MAG: TonB-dependent receptor [Sphingobacteriia bacterium]
MFKNCVFIFYCCIGSLSANAQAKNTSLQNDSVLKEVIVTAFNIGKRWKEVPASIAVVSSKDLSVYAPTSFVPVFNSLPGIRMEERSPGSYRLSVRGSSLRSPFGVRNVKVYWNEIPLTDATGNTYINLIDLQSVNQIEIAKGPASSMYGAGTGGAILLNKIIPFSDSARQSFNLGLTVGSYGLNQQEGEWVYNKPAFSSSLQVNRLSSNGYREQSFLQKNGLVWQTNIRYGKGIFNTLFFITDLSYGTPGGITLSQMQLNPQLSRQATATLPGAVQQKTAVYNQTIFGAISHKYQFNESNTIKWFVSLNRTSFANPFITNYEKRNETNVNLGLQHIYLPFSSNNNIQWVNGFELLMNESVINNFVNNAGVQGSVISKDFIYSKQQFLFSQIKMSISNKLIITAGFSMNNQLYDYTRLTDPMPGFTSRRINAPFVPRFSFSYAVHKNMFLYGVVAKGFSSPSLAEVRPSDGKFYPFLEAEKGWNVEAGIKGNFFQNKLLFDLSVYQFKLNNAIVRRNDLAGAEYFVNAGAALQEGIELLIKGNLRNRESGWVEKFSINGALSYQPYRFLEYQQGVNSFNGNTITGIPKTIAVIGFQMILSKAYYLNASINANAKIPLNDANTVFADNYQLLQAKFGKIIRWRKNGADIFIGGDNLLNQLYSLGNDINAAGNRYFNPAATKNFYAGIRFNFQ